ncbi:exonuclease III [Bradyrhizobium japonicum]
MIFKRRYDLVLAIQLQSRGFAFVLFEGWLAPVDWGVQDLRGADKNARCLARVASLVTLHTPDVLVLQDMSERGTVRAQRIQELDRRIAELADQRGILVRRYSRAEVIEHFEEQGARTKQRIAEAITKHIPALGLYVPRARKPWMSEDARMGIFDAAALAWMYFRSINGG